MSNAKPAHDVLCTLKPQAGKRARIWPEKAWRENPLRRGVLGSLLFALMLVAACAPMAIESKDSSGDLQLPVLAPLFAFLASAQTSEVGVVEDPRTGESVRVTAGQGYHAASGRFCRRFNVMAPQSYKGMTEGLACRDEEGRWTASKLLTNPDDLEAPRLQYP